MKMKAIRGLLLVACIGLILIPFNTAMAKEEGATQEQTLTGHQVIKVNYPNGINPETLKVNRGTTVIWLNEATAPVSIAFTSKEITTACENPVNFKKDTLGAFTAKKVKFGAVASICFIEKGTYQYKVTRPSQMKAAGQKGAIEAGKEFMGTIVVE
jgi:plastocyanin